MSPTTHRHPIQPAVPKGTRVDIARTTQPREWKKYLGGGEGGAFFFFLFWFLSVSKAPLPGVRILGGDSLLILGRIGARWLLLKFTVAQRDVRRRFSMLWAPEVRITWVSGSQYSCTRTVLVLSKCVQVRVARVRYRYSIWVPTSPESK